MKRKIKLGHYVPTDKDREMHEIWKSGLTLQEVGNIYGITRERVRQILNVTFGLTAKDNLIRRNRVLLNGILRKYDQLNNSKKLRGIRYHTVFGCHEEIVNYINGKPFNWTKEFRYGCKAGEYLSQRNSASNRGIAWNIHFPEWWRIWEESGKYKLRGRGKGYCMARYGDSGAYEPENVYICTIGQNFSDMYILREKTTHCKRGHERTAENKVKNGSCRECGRILAKIKYYSKAAA